MGVFQLPALSRRTTMAADPSRSITRLFRYRADDVGPTKPMRIQLTLLKIPWKAFVITPPASRSAFSIRLHPTQDGKEKKSHVFPQQTLYICAVVCATTTRDSKTQPAAAARQCISPVQHTPFIDLNTNRPPGLSVHILLLVPYGSMPC